MSDPAIDARTSAWLQAGIITAEQARQIAAFEAQAANAAAAAAPPIQAEAVHEPTQAPVRDRMASAVGTLGELLVGLGVLLTVAANWDDVSDTGKLLTILVTMMISYALGLRADRGGHRTWPGTAAYTVAMLIFAGGVFLLGQTFNVQAHDPLGFLIVAITGSAVAVLAGRKIVGWIAAAAWLAWALHEIFTSALHDTDEQAFFLLLVSGLLLALAALAVGWALDGIAARASRRDMAAGSPPSLTADVHALGSPFRGVALGGLLIALLPVSFAWQNDGDPVELVNATPVVIIALVLVAIATVLASRHADLRARQRVAAAVAGAALITATAGVVQNLVVAAIAANALLLLGGIGLAALGLAEDRRGEYAWGVVWIIALIVARYFDVMVFADLGGIAFIGAGFALIGCAWLIGRSRKIWQERGAL